MEEINLKPAADEAASLLQTYLSERVHPHPILRRHLPDASICLLGAAAIGDWDERSELEIRFILPNDEHVTLADELQRARLWDPRRDFRVHIQDREPFRRFPGADLLFLSLAQLEQEFRATPVPTLWCYSRAATLEDTSGILEATLHAAGERFAQELGNLRCRHYFLFRQARNELAQGVVPRRVSAVLAIKRGEAVREALRLAFLAEGRPYPPDVWLEPMAERETECGASIVTAVRALLSARDAPTVEHASKVLRDRVAFALQQGGVSERWLEQWWLWPWISPSEA
jgi:hypothetical protein